ncbi:hypothetical protein NPIL_122561 [Nephila pilipes]|uniref:Uncharacterized protein n=1 Tax=Nephila pilipes TaxID=299642 RepID=A0A8X6P2D8_NEPPI|nr:hypothetical protein NPIL_122561 [Nephila pilipes]
MRFLIWANRIPSVPFPPRPSKRQLLLSAQHLFLGSKRADPRLSPAVGQFWPTLKNKEQPLHLFASSPFVERQPFSTDL